MAQHALVGIPLGVFQLLRNELAVGVLGVVALDLREDAAERRRELDQRVVLLGREVVLGEFLALDVADDQFLARRAADEALGADAHFVVGAGRAKADAAAVRGFVPFLQVGAVLHGVGAHVGDFNADRT